MKFKKINNLENFPQKCCILASFGNLWRHVDAWFSQKCLLTKFLFSPVIKSCVFSYKLYTLVNTFLISARCKILSVSEVFFATKIQNPGVSSLTKVLTQDCLSLITVVYLVFGPVLSPPGHQEVSLADKFQAFPATSSHFQRFPAISRHSQPLQAIFRPFQAVSSHIDPISDSFSQPLTALS